MVTRGQAALRRMFAARGKQAEASRLTGIPQCVLYSYRTGKIQPRDSRRKLLEESLGIPAAWWGLPSRARADREGTR